jgi:hypothetical protein
MFKFFSTMISMDLTSVLSSTFIFRKGLVKVFDKLKTGELKEGSSLSFLVRQMHENR